MNYEPNFVEECLGPIDRLVIYTGRFVDEAVPRSQWPLSFMVDYIEAGPDGGALGVWYGPTHREAVAAAKDFARAFGDLPIVDQTFGGTLQ